MATIKKRAIAKRDGDLIYYTGKACTFGHYAGRYVSTGNCVKCLELRFADNLIKTREQRAKFVTMKVHVSLVETVKLMEAMRDDT